jgi:hypothetical protein
MRKAGELFGTHAAEISEWLVKEAGSIPPKAGLEIHVAEGECFEASALPSHPMGSVLPSNDPHWSFMRRRPSGVVTVIAPFNFPLILSIRTIAPAIALGNAVVFKPDPRTAVGAGAAIIRIFEEAGLPPGVFQLVNGGADVGEAVVTAPEVRVVSFTGSTLAGRKVGELGGKHLKRTHLELGGNNALIVLPGVDIAKAASELGVPYTLVTGITVNDQYIDNVLATPETVVGHEKFERIEAVFSGAGETLSAALAALIATGLDLSAAASEALHYLDRCLDEGFRPGMGKVIPDRLFWALPDAEDGDDEAEAEGPDMNADFFEMPINDTKH